MCKYEQAINHYNYGISHDIFSEPVTSYAELAVEALKKQKPKKIKRKFSTYFCIEEAYCPLCNTFFGLVGYEQNNFCPECGQALDWSETL